MRADFGELTSWDVHALDAVVSCEQYGFNRKAKFGARPGLAIAPVRQLFAIARASDF